MIESYWEYQWRSWKETVRVEELTFVVVVCIICCLIWGWWGFLITYGINKVLLTDGGLNYDLNTYPPKPKPNTKCVSGNIDCKVCDKDGYFDYKKKKWYNI